MSLDPKNSSSPAMDDAPGVAGDIACRSCGYNLRSLHPRGLCPECGSAVELSLRGDLLRYADADWVATLARGTSVIASGCIAGFFMLGFVVFAYGPKAPLLVLSDPAVEGPGFRPIIAPNYLGLGALAGFAVCAVGAWMLTTADPSRNPENRHDFVRAFIRAAAIFVAGDTFMQVFARGAAVSPDAALLLRLLDWTADGAAVLGMAAQLHYLQVLARRVPVSRKALRAGILKWALPIVYLIWLVIALLRWHGVLRSPPAYLMTHLADSTRIAGVAFLAGWIGYFVLLVTMWKTLRAQAALALLERNKTGQDLRVG